jgi:lipocalin
MIWGVRLSLRAFFSSWVSRMRRHYVNGRSTRSSQLAAAALSLALPPPRSTPPLMKCLVAVAVAVAAVVLLASSAASASAVGKKLDGAAIKRAHMEQIKTRKDLQWPPATIPALNVTAYLGLWYNVYADLLVLATFQNNSLCATAKYGPVGADGHVGVFNWERQYSESGPERNISGFAVQVHPQSAPGQLAVTLDHAGVDAPYWIFNISPIVDGRYQWAIVSDEFYATLFILARDLKQWERVYEKTVLAIAAKRGFKGLNGPIKVRQGPRCNYPKE